jgi:hypothetical protein
MLVGPDWSRHNVHNQGSLNSQDIIQRKQTPKRSDYGRIFAVATTLDLPKQLNG